jgi:hypothetical protein
LYLQHSSDRNRGCYQVVPGSYKERLEVELPEGRYSAEWVDPASGSVVSSETIDAAGGKWPLATPTYAVDIALRIHRR